MAPLLFLIAGTLGTLAAGRLGVRRLRPWPVPLRAGLALMFTVTGIAHFVGKRQDLIETHALLVGRDGEARLHDQFARATTSRIAAASSRGTSSCRKWPAPVFVTTASGRTRAR